MADAGVRRVRIERSVARSEGASTPVVTAWAGVDAGSVGLLTDHADASVNALLGNMVHAAAGQAYLEWTRYRDAGELHRQLVVPEEASDRRTFDALMQCAVRIAVTHSMTQGAAERLVDTAVALRDRLPNGR